MSRKRDSVSKVPNVERAWRSFIYLVRAWVVSLAVGLLLLGVSHLLPPAILSACTAAVSGVTALLLVAAIIAGVAHTVRAGQAHEAGLVAAACGGGIARLEALLARHAS